LPAGLIDQPFYGWETRPQNLTSPLQRASPEAMSRRSYSEINLHFVWHVKSSLPIISPEIEPGLFRHIRSYALQSPGLIFHEIGGT
jgi:hypothetical protein